jgi:polyisoprenoid-binding protein YceI
MSELTTSVPVRVVDGVEVPTAGGWVIDPAHTTVGFWVRHLGITKVRGRFTGVGGTVHVGADPLSSSVSVDIAASSIDTNEPDRDAHLRSEDFLDVERHPSLRFTSTSVTRRGTRWAITGELTIRGVTRTVVLDTEFGGGAVDPWGEAHVMFSAETTIEREDFGLTWNQVLETGGVLVGKRITIELEVSLVPGGG